jgi:hypothetical protein
MYDSIGKNAEKGDWLLLLAGCSCLLQASVDNEALKLNERLARKDRLASSPEKANHLVRWRGSLLPTL